MNKAPMDWATFREQIRAIMRGEGDPDAAAAHDLIREVTEWHDEGRPNAARTLAAAKAETQGRRAAMAAGTILSWQDSHGCRRPISCDWESCGEAAAKYVTLDDYIGPYDKATLCADHVSEWKAGKAGRQQHVREKIRRFAEADAEGWNR